MLGIPDVIISGVITGTIALAGVIATNLIGRSNLKTQLQHDSKEKSRERINLLKREIYVKVIDEVAKFDSLLQSLYEIDLLSPEVRKELSGLSTVIAKVKLMADQKTTDIAFELSGRYTDAMATLLKAAGPCQKIISDIKIHENLSNEFREKWRKTFQEMRSINESGKSDPTRYNALQSSYNYDYGEYSKHNNIVIELNRRKHDAVTIYIRQSLLLVSKLGETKIKMMAAMREEFGLMTNLDHELAIQKRALEKGAEFLETVIKDTNENFPLDDESMNARSAELESAAQARSKKI